ncbi:MAG: hypothetical protein DHS20C16_24590 [Phycisphaerae bacterium]|nr:MAG: hypothetical protein DHS20C16_24590 [Phycisphaerae bacterium]
MAYANPIIPNSEPASPPLHQHESDDPKKRDSQKKRDKIDRFESVLKLRDTHPFGPKGALARWLDEFSEFGDNGTCPPPMA